MQFYCNKIDINTRHLYNGDAPLILASTHPNSFFDAMILGALHPRTFYFLARGDAFKKPWAAALLRLINLRPIYRISEGKENLDKNRQTFTESVKILDEKGAIIIFSEGVSVNEWKLRPLKKGTGRIAWMCWVEDGVQDLVVQPVGMNYHSFKDVPKRICIEYGSVITSSDFTLDNSATFYNEFNELLTERLEPLCLPENSERFKKKTINSVFKVLLVLPALLGYIIHYPVYSWWKGFVRKKTVGTVFYDSVLFASMLLVYPVLVLLITLVVTLIAKDAIWLLLFVLIPFTAWSFKQFKAA